MPRMNLVAILRTIEPMKAIFPLILPVIFLGLLLGKCREVIFPHPTPLEGVG